MLKLLPSMTLLMQKHLHILSKTLAFSRFMKSQNQVFMFGDSLKCDPYSLHLGLTAESPILECP